MLYNILGVDSVEVASFVILGLLIAGPVVIAYYFAKKQQDQAKAQANAQANAELDQAIRNWESNVRALGVDTSGPLIWRAFENDPNE